MKMKVIALLPVVFFAISVVTEEKFDPQIDDIILLSHLLPFDMDESLSYEDIIKSMTKEQKDELRKLLELLQKKIAKEQATTESTL